MQEAEVVFVENLKCVTNSKLQLYVLFHLMGSCRLKLVVMVKASQKVFL